MHTLFIWLLSCKGCGQCWYFPTAPNVTVTDPPPFDTAAEEPPEDTGEDEDLPPSSVCDYEEVEPNTAVDPQPLTLEHWMCGTFGQALDADVFSFEADEDTWLRVWVRASSLGSFANPRLFIQDEDEEFNLDAVDSLFSEEIDRTFKLDEYRSMVVGLFEQNSGLDQFGEEYFWRMRVSVAKPPVRWDYEEDEPNDDSSEAMPIEAGDRIYGDIEKGTRNDWFALEVTEPNSEVTVETDSWSHGSPLNPEIEVRFEDETDAIDEAYRHDSSTNYDAKVSFRAEEAGTYKIRVGSYDEKGGIPYWYVLDVSVSPAESGSGDSDDTGE